MSCAEPATADYESALSAWLAGAGENALTAAYELGRRMLGNGLGLMELADVHHEAVRTCLERVGPGKALTTLNSAASFFSEVLSSFDMHLLRVDESNSALRRANDLLEEEIRRVSLALHSEAGNILAQATLEIDLMAKSVAAEVQPQLAQLRQVLTDTGERLRHFSHELRPSVLDHFGLVPALQFLAEGVQRRTGMQVRVEGARARRVASRVELAAYRVAQEAVNNALRHGGEPVNISIRVEMQDDGLHCVISDDGDGFDVAEVLEHNSRPGLGLIGMRERATALAGDCRFESRPGGGTTVHLDLPL